MGQQTKVSIVLEGLSGQIDITKLCQKYQVSQAQYYKWRDQFLANCHESFEVKKKTDKEQRLEAQNQKLRNIIGDLTIELKKANTTYETPTRQVLPNRRRFQDCLILEETSSV